MKLHKVLLSFVIILSSAMLSNADELNTKLDKISRKLAAIASEKGLSGATLAVFPLQADEKLKKKRVDFAVGEILGHHLLKTATFTMVERIQLYAVMKEQKIGASGAVDTRTAAGIGKVLGAKLLVTGGVMKLGNSYQIAVKLVDSETAEIIASEIAEIEIETFDKEAAPYLMLVPQSQAIGVFVGYFGQVGASAEGIPQQMGNWTIIPTFRNDTNKIIYSGNWGIRYWIHPRYMVQADYAYVGRENRGDFDKTLIPGGYSKYYAHFTSGYRGNIFRIVINRTGQLSKVFNWNAGIGAARYTGRLRDFYFTAFNPVVEGYYVSSIVHSFKFISPFLRAGIEWKPQQRLGWNISANWNVLRKTVRMPAAYNYYTISPWTNQTEYHDIGKLIIPQLSIDSSLALYF